MVNIVDFRRKRNNFSKIMSNIKQLNSINVIPYTTFSVNHTDVIRVDVDYNEDVYAKHPLAKMVVSILDDIGKHHTQDNKTHMFLVTTLLKEIYFILNRDVIFAVLIDITPTDYLHNANDVPFICTAYKRRFDKYQREFIKYIKLVTDITYNLDDILSNHDASSSIYMEHFDNLRYKHIDISKVICRYAINTIKTMLDKMAYVMSTTVSTKDLDGLTDNKNIEHISNVYNLYLNSFVDIVSVLLKGQNIVEEEYLKQFRNNIKDGLKNHLSNKHVSDQLLKKINDIIISRVLGEVQYSVV